VAEALYRGFKARPPLLPITRARVDPTKSFDYLRQLVRAGPPGPSVEGEAATPFVGITTDGRPQPGLYHLGDTGLDPAPIVAAALDLDSALDPHHRCALHHPVDAAEWRKWTNAYPGWEPHGVFLADLDQNQREAALALVRASLSAKGFDDVQGAMRLNGELGQLLGQYLDTLSEWTYWIALFGSPSVDAPFGWQLYGHHVCVSCFVLEHQMVLSPTFLGAELESQQLFEEHRVVALELMAALSPAQRDRAVLYPSMRADDLPPDLAGPADGRHLGGAGQDNRVVPYAGLRADGLTPGQQELLWRVLETFWSRLRPGPAEARLEEARRHLADTYLAWIGTTEAERPFYYRIHSPVVLAEYDNHPGIFLDFDEPEPFHVHTVIRTPNGNDYGRDLLRQHYERHHQRGGR
jgi:Protein of unknown function (DUF3500)